MIQAGSPTSNNQIGTGQWPPQAQEMLMMLYQQGVEMGLNQAQQAHTIPSQMMLPLFNTPYPPHYFPQYDNAMGTYGGPNGAPSTYAHGGNPYGNPNATARVVPPQYTQAAATTQYAQYEQARDYTESATPRHAPPAYVWPVPNGENGPTPSSTLH